MNTKPFCSDKQNRSYHLFLLAFTLVDRPMLLLTFSTAIPGGTTNAALVQFQAILSTLITSWNTIVIILILFLLKARLAAIPCDMTNTTMHLALACFATRITCGTIGLMNWPMGIETFLVAIVDILASLALKVDFL